MTARKPAGTFVPATVHDRVTTSLDAQSLRETARQLLRVANRLDGKSSRVTFQDLPAGSCADCGEFAQGDRCPTCGTPAHTTRSRA